MVGAIEFAYIMHMQLMSFLIIIIKKESNACNNYQYIISIGNVETDLSW